MLQLVMLLDTHIQISRYSLCARGAKPKGKCGTFNLNNVIFVDIRF